MYSPGSAPGSMIMSEGAERVRRGEEEGEELGEKDCGVDAADGDRLTRLCVISSSSACDGGCCADEFRSTSTSARRGSASTDGGM